MKISVKVALGFAVMAALSVISNLGGYWGVTQLADKLRFVAGPNWETAQGTSQTITEVQFATFSLFKYIEGFATRVDTENEIAVHLEAAKAKLEEIRGAGLTPDEELQKVEDALIVFGDSSIALINSLAGTTIEETFQQFAQDSGHLVSLLKTLESTTNSQVQATRADIDALVANSVSAIMIIFAVVVVISILGWILGRVFLVRPIKLAADSLNELSRGDGDLTVKLDIKTSDEIEELANAFNEFVAKLHGSIERVAQVNENLVSSSTAMVDVIEHTNQNAGQQFDEIQQVSSAIHEMTATSQEVARYASDASNSINEALDKSNEGQAVVNNTFESMQELERSINNSTQVVEQLHDDSKNIGSVLDVIKAIAEQTNLLALNAAIEAARAGEQGRGFAVVADEVRTLAQRTQCSTSEIEDIISKLQAQAQTTVDEMSVSKHKAQEVMEHATQAGVALAAINDAVETTTNMNLQIASAAEEQTAVAEEINRNVVNIQDLASDTKDRAQNCQETSQGLACLTTELRQVTQGFKF